ncbi:hypothetical protein HBB16_00285 [Pseudonocardia sp. MCCB 268]|nr:hypothetical protein [Pseudonocardia cytotoxica]
MPGERHADGRWPARHRGPVRHRGRRRQRGRRDALPDPARRRGGTRLEPAPPDRFGWPGTP